MPSTDWPSPLTPRLPHVDQILCQSHGLRVPRDGDGPVQVSRGVSVLAVGDPDHGSGELSAMVVMKYCGVEIEPHLISATLEPPLPIMQPISSLGTVISWVCCWAAWFRAWPVSRARAGTERVSDLEAFYIPSPLTPPSTLPVSHPRQEDVKNSILPPFLKLLGTYWVLSWL